MYDMIIRGGSVVDGQNRDAFSADIAIAKGRIVEVGRVTSRAHRVVDADGLLITPGFVDVHTHYDAQVTWDPSLAPSSWHGCTTVMMGNCGVGFAPVKPEERDFLIGLMEGVEDIPGAALSEGIVWEWETFEEYLQALSKRHTSIDFGAQLPHGALRAYVMGERGANNEDATAEDLAAMSTLVERAITAGAFGFSTSRTLLHKAIDGRYVPGTFAPKEELWAIGRAASRAGAQVFQMACDHASVPDELAWMGELSNETGLRVMFNLSQIDQAPELWRDVYRGLRAINEGPGRARVSAQVAGRAIGVLMTWRGTAHPFALKPSWLAMANRPWSECWARLQEPAFRQQLIDEEPVVIGAFETFVTESWHKMFPIDAGYEPRPDQSIAVEAQRRGVPPAEVAMEHLMVNEDAMLYFPLFNYSDGNLDALRALHTSPHTMMGLSDAGAHCGAICDGGMPTFMLTHWARDRAQGIPLPQVIHRQTQATARSFGLKDRGVIAPGYRADLNIIDMEQLCLRRPEMRFDLPAGGRRLVQRAAGYRMTLCNGVPIVENDTLTDHRPGRLLKVQMTH